MLFRYKKWLVAGLLTLTVTGIAAQSAWAEVAKEQVAKVEELKAEAFKALRTGAFDRTNDLLHRAAELSDDASLTQMAEWTRVFEEQRGLFASERRKQYDKAVADVQTLIAGHKEGFAIDAAVRAYSLSDDKKAFRALPWVDDLVKQSTQMARAYETSEQWLKALRLYSDLGSIEPANPDWKERLKVSTRRIRLLAMYTPDELKVLQEFEMAERRDADALVNPTTQPATVPTTQAGADDSFRIDWKETLRGIKFEMLKDALGDARTNYWREASYRDMMLGGLEGVHALATTRGLEKTFVKLSDVQKRQKFVDAIETSTQRMRNTTAGNEQMVASQVLRDLNDVNRQTLDLPEGVLVSEFADGAFAELDQFTSMIWPYDLDEFNKTTQGEFSGVGIQIQTDKDGSLRVVSPIEDSPAYKSGIKAGDVVTHINGKSAKGITLNQAVKTITGQSGTTVSLSIRSPDGTTKNYTIRRETIKVASIKGYLHRVGGGWDYTIDPVDNIAYIRLTNFTKSSADELDKAYDDIRAGGARAVILDLRNNPGGLLTAATEVTDKFLNTGVIVSTRADRDTPNQPTVATARPDDKEVMVPTVVLVNQYSASASEIVSGALKDQKRALVVGERTFGKGSVQMLFPLSNRSAFLKLTTSHYYLPSGRCIHREENSLDWGVDPDVPVEMTPKQMEDAIKARQDLDVLHDAAFIPTTAPAVISKHLLDSDPQLSAAILLLKLQLAGARL